MKVHEILASKGAEVVTTRIESAVGEIARLLIENHIGSAVVTDADGQIVGVIAERDIVRGLAAYGAEALAMSVEVLMTREVVYCEPTDAVMDVMAVMTARRVRHMPVLHDGELAGIVSIGDIVKSRIAETETEANVLRDYITAR